MEKGNCVKVNFVERSNGAAADVKVEVTDGATKEQMEELANLAYQVAKATFEEATAYTYMFSKK